MGIKITPIFPTILNEIYSYIVSFYGFFYTWKFTFDNKIPDSLLQIDEPHHAIHLGQSFVYSFEDKALPNGSETSFIWIGTREGERNIHLSVQVRARGKQTYFTDLNPSVPLYDGYATLKIYENVNEPVGSEQSVINRNRIIASVPEWKVIYSQSGTWREEDLIYSESFNKYQGIISPLREHTEFIFDRDSRGYLITIQPFDVGRDDTYFQIVLNWYEEVI